MEEYLGYICGLSASAAWALASLFYFRVPLSASSVAVMKNVLAAVPMAVLLWAVSAWRGSALFTASIHDWAMLGASAVIGLWIGDAGYFRSLQLLGARRGLTLTLLTPPVTALMSMAALDEWLAPLEWCAMAVTVLGVYTVMREQTGEGVPPCDAKGLRWGVACGLLGVFCQSLGAILLKIPVAHLPTIEANTIRLLVAAAAGLLFGVLRGQAGGWRRLAANRRGAADLAVAALFGTLLGVWFMLASYKFAPAGVAATMTSTAPLFVIPISRVLFGHTTSLRGLAGAAVAFAGICLFFAARR